MPNRDGKGPEGVGPTGRGLGECTEASPNQGLGQRRGCGCGRGFGRRCNITQNQTDSSVEEKIEELSKQIEELKKRL